MPDDPVRYWQDLTENYRQMGDEQLRELADDIGSLTVVAQQVLRDEMRKRGLSESESRMDMRKGPVRPAAINLEPVRYRNSSHSYAEDEETGAGPHEFTWKVLLSECETDRQAWQLAEALRRAGIESWIQAAEAHSPFGGSGLGYARVNVAADQLEPARVIAAQPIPQDIVEASILDPAEAAEFEAPVCPKCGAADPVLESVEPVNTWECEACGAQWSDPEEPASTVDGAERSSAP